jgi:CheY-like chemotaxis protein
MNENNKFALVRKTPSAVEKAEPGAKRVLSGMVLDALALANREQHRRPSPPRIVVVNDESVILEQIETVIRYSLKNAVVLPFQDGEAAWKDLLRTDPDLLITDLRRPGMNGWDLLRLLAQRKVKFPILVTSGTGAKDAKKDIRRCAGPDLNVTFWRMPFPGDQLERYLREQLGAAP